MKIKICRICDLIEYIGNLNKTNKILYDTPRNNS